MRKISQLLLLSLSLQPLNVVAHPTQVFNTEPYKPYNYLDESGNVVGPINDIMKETCRLMSLDCKFKLLPWKRAYSNAKNGLINGLFSIGKNAEREKWMYFSPPIVITRHGFFAHQDNEADLSRLENLVGYKIFTYGPSNTSRMAETIAKEIGNIKVVIETLAETPFKKLNYIKTKKATAPKLTAVFFNMEVGNMIIREKNLKNLHTAGIYKHSYYYIGFPMETNSKLMADIYNETILEVLANKEYTSQITARYGIDLVIPR